MPTAVRLPPSRRDELASLSVADLAAAQHGVVSAAQLAAAGVSSSTVGRWAQTGRLQRLYRGVYAYGHACLRPEGRWMAAVLACGPGAVLSHRSAAALWALRATARATVEVTSPGASGRALAGIDAHHHPLHPDDRAAVDGVPVTSVPRTLVDLAAVVPADALAKALERAEGLRLFDLGAVDAAVERAAGRRGIQRLRHALSEYRPDPAFTRSELERSLRRLLRDAGLQMPAANPWTTDQEVDVVWDDLRLAIELDSWEHHSSRAAFERDRRRGLALEARGYRVLRLSWRQVMREPDTVLAALDAILRAPDGPRMRGRG